MKTRKRLLLPALSAFLFVGGATLAAPRQDQKPDNSRANRGDASKDAVTADQQKMNPADRERTQEVRKALLKDKSLSTYAHNVKIITRDGHVTLKGPVRSDEEKARVVAKATEVAGAGNVTDELTVAPRKQQ